jgi:anaphase-promoting complex subunit 5
MARYLTPAKVGLLALVELYTDEAVPSDAVLPVLSFITAHLMDHDSTDPLSSQETRWTKAERAVSLVITIKDFEKLLGSYPFLMGMPGRKLWDQFLGRLWEINSLDALNEFFEKIADMLARTKEELHGDDGNDIEQAETRKIRLSRNSPFGAFIRKSRLEYQRLRFHDCTELWKAFVRYRQPTAHYLRRKNPSFGRLSFDNVLLLGEQEDWGPTSVSALAAVAYGDMLMGDEGGTIPVSTDDVESLLEFQIEQMQSKSISIVVGILC